MSLQLNMHAPENFFPVELEYHSTGIKFISWANRYLLFIPIPNATAAMQFEVIPQGIISKSSFDRSRIEGFINQVASRIQRFKQLAALGTNMLANHGQNRKEFIRSA